MRPLLTGNGLSPTLMGFYMVYAYRRTPPYLGMELKVALIYSLGRRLSFA
jgi:hypothetical protein